MRQLSGKPVNGWCVTLQDAVYTLSKTSISIVSQAGRQHKSRNQGAEDGMASLSLTPVPHVPLGDSVFPTPTVLGSARLDILVGRCGVLFLELSH